MRQQNRGAVREALALWPEMFGFAVQFARDRAKAEDLCQEAYLRFFGMERPIDDSRPLRPLLLTILRNLARSQARRVEPGSLDDLMQDTGGFEDADADDPALRAGVVEESDVVRATLARMNPTWRAALYLADGLGLGYAEIAGILEKSEDVVRVTLHRARQRVRVMLKERLSERTES